MAAINPTTQKVEKVNPVEFRSSVVLWTGGLILFFNILGVFYINFNEKFDPGFLRFTVISQLIVSAFNLTMSYIFFDRMTNRIFEWLRTLEVNEKPAEALIQDAWMQAINFPIHFIPRATLYAYVPSATVFIIAAIFSPYTVSVATVINLVIGNYFISVGNLFVLGVLIHKWIFEPVRLTFMPYASYTHIFYKNRLSTYLSVIVKVVVSFLGLMTFNTIGLGAFAYFTARPYVTPGELNTILIRVAIFVTIVIFFAGVVAYLIAILFSKNIDEVRAKMKQISQEGGDLRERIAITSDDEMGKLVYWFNDLLAKLQELIGQTFKTMKEVTDATRMLSDVNEQVAASMEEMATSVQQISRGAEAQSKEITTVVQKAHQFAELATIVSSGAIEADQTTKDIAEASTRGKRSSHESQQRMQSLVQVTGESVNAVRVLIQKSNEIKKFVGNVENIASQTNLLALNAAIEAARAGEHGRGFSVVAEEVRKLAKDSNIALKQISTRVNEIQEATDSVITWITQVEEEVDYGRAMFDSMGSILEQINMHIQKNSSRIQEIVTSSQHQQGEIIQLVDSLSSVARIAEDNDASSHSAATAIEEQMASISEMATHHQNLQYHVEKLQELISHFKV